MLVLLAIEVVLMTFEGFTFKVLLKVGSFNVVIFLLNVLVVSLVLD